jgi:hypothetical protein
MRSTRCSLAALALLAACGTELPTGSSPLPDTESESIAMSLDVLAGDAAALGDESAREAYADGALAIRLGAIPTEIAVEVGGETFRYWAVVTGIVDRGPDGVELLKRSLVAWTGDGRVDAVLKVVSRSDEAQFGRDHSGRDPGMALGSWVDLARQHRFTAIEGSAATTLGQVGPECPNAERDQRFECHLARFDARIDGLFELNGDATVRLPIATSPDGIAGVVVRRTDGGTGGRPTTTARPGRPLPTRG